MEDKIQEQCENVLKQLREMDKQNKSGSQTMEFEKTHEGGEKLIALMDKVQKEGYLEELIAKQKEIAQAEKDYLEQFHTDSIGWAEV